MKKILFFTILLGAVLNYARTETSLMEYVRRADIKQIQYALQQEGDIDATNQKGETALLKAVQMNEYEIANILMKAGADINKQDYLQDSPFLYASAEGRTEILRAMLSYKPNVKIYNRYGGTGLIPAAEKGHLDNVILLLEGTTIDINHINQLGWTALLEAIVLTDGSERYQEIIRILIKHGADVNLADKEGISPLAHAQKKGYHAISTLLINAGAKK